MSLSVTTSPTASKITQNCEQPQQPTFFTRLKAGAKKATHFVKDTICSTIKIASEAAIPIIAGSTTYLFSAVMEDRVLSKIVGGAGCMLLGGYLTAKSAVPRILLRKMLGCQDVSHQKITSARVFVAIGGTTIFLYGASNFLTGIQELFGRMFFSAQSTQEEEKLFQELDVRAHSTVEFPSDKQLVKTLVQKVRECPRADKLWNELQQEGGFSVQLGARNEIPNLSVYDTVSRTTFIQRDLADTPTHNTKRTYLLFEMCNAKHREEGLAVHTACARGDMAAEEFGKELFLVERQSAKLHHEITQQCIKSQNWDSKMDLFKSYFVGKSAPWKTEESAWNNYKDNPGMKGNRMANIQMWLQNCAQEYCTKHAEESDCVYLASLKASLKEELA